MKSRMRLARIRTMIPPQRMGEGDPRSMFYGDPVEIDPEDAQDAIGHEVDAMDVPAQAIAADVPSEPEAARRVQAYEQLSPTEKAVVTMLPALATWNAFTIVNPMLGKVSANSLNYMLLKALNEYPFQGCPVLGQYNAGIGGHTVTINATALGINPTETKLIALPFFRFTISSSTLTSRPGAQITIDIQGRDDHGTIVNTASLGYTHTFQRLNSTEAIVGVFIPTQVVATRTLPFLPIAGQEYTEDSVVIPHTVVITFKGTLEDEQVTVTVPGYATSELREISQMYSLPAGQIK